MYLWFSQNQEWLVLAIYVSACSRIVFPERVLVNFCILFQIYPIFADSFNYFLVEFYVVIICNYSELSMEKLSHAFFFFLVLSWFYFLIVKNLIHLEINLVKTMSPTFFLLGYPNFVTDNIFFFFFLLTCPSFPHKFWDGEIYHVIQSHIYLFLDFVLCPIGLFVYPWC